MTYTTAYDYWLAQYWGAYWTEMPWVWLKAQAIAESSLNPNARSPVGAMGLLQFMPDTWSEIKGDLNFPTLASPLDPQYCIQAGAYYMRKLWDTWVARRTPLDRLHLSHAAYNAGIGTCLKAQDRAGGANDYTSIAPYLPDETRAYVTRIGIVYLELTEPVVSSGTSES